MTEIKTRLGLFLLIYCSLSFTQNVNAQYANESDSLVLVSLYNATAGENWTDPWILDSPVSTWEGVTLNDGRVEYLNLSNRNLVGKIPECIGDLNFLTSLSFYKNKLSDTIPMSICNLQQLKTLGLLDNELKGTIPECIVDLFKLEYLALSGNKLSGRIPSSIGNLIHLESLYLHENDLSDTIPSSICDLEQLVALHLESNKLSGKIPNGIGSLSQLRILKLSGNDLSDTIPSSICDLKQLSSLNLGDNELEGGIPDSIGNLSQLRFLDLSANPLGGGIPSSIGNLKKLAVLNLIGNSLEGSIPNSIGDLENLTSISLYNNHLSGAIPSSICNLKQLTILNVGGSNLEGVLPDSIGNLVNLASLILYNNSLSGALPSSIGDLRQLKYLSLHGNNFDGEIPESICSLVNLEDLRLNGNDLVGTIPSAIGNLDQLIIINFSNNMLEGKIPTSIGTLTNLTYLNLWKNQFTGKIPTSIINLSLLKDLFLYDNYFKSKDLEILREHPNWGDFDNFIYAPQDITQVSISGYKGAFYDSTVVLTIPFDGVDTEYTWYKDGEQFTDTNDSIYTFITSSVRDAGEYSVEVNHPDFPLLAYESMPHEIIVFGIDSLRGTYIPNQFIMEFDSMSTAQDREALRMAVNATVVDSCMCGDILQVWKYENLQNEPLAFPDGNGGFIYAHDPNDIVKKKRNATGIDDAGFNYLTHPDDTNKKQEKYYLPSILQQNVYKPPVQNPVRIAMLDSGIKDTLDYTSLYLWNNDDYALDNNCINDPIGYDFTYEDDAPNESQNHLHATKMLATILNNIAPEVDNQIEVVNTQIFDNEGHGVLFDAICGIYYSIDENPDLLNMSWSYYGEPSGILERALKKAEDKDILMIASAGNGLEGQGQDIEIVPFYPAAYDFKNLLTVAASQDDEELTSFSNFSDSMVALAAPGQGIEVWGRDVLYNGTSYSTALVSAFAASYMAKYPAASSEEIIEALRVAIYPAEALNIEWKGILDHMNVSLALDCESSANPVVLTTVRGGFQPLRYQWSDGSEETYYTNLENGEHSVTITDDIGYISVVDFQIEDCLLTNNNEVINTLQQEQIAIYPNPSSEMLTVQLPFIAKNETVFSLYHTNGQLVMQRKIQDNNSLLTIDVSKLPVGIYISKTKIGKQLFTNRIAISR